MADQSFGNDRLSMLDEHGHRKLIIPAEVRGRYASMKMKVQGILLLVFLGLPWIQIGGAQAILLDLPQRQFFFFGLHLSAHDAPLIFLLLLAFVSGLALVTALWGRVWCGWACPQTVFIERVYRQIEIWVEGSYIERRRMQQEAANFKSLSRRILKWILYLFVSTLIAHSFIAYWTGSERLLGMMTSPPADNWSYFVWVFSITCLLLFNFGWFREQFCLIACPYGKLQSTLLDSHSVTVMYDDQRGEPRKSPAVVKDRQGDCVSCQRCVQVCPTGIDIRQGVQMECIGCTACMDACDDIMAKVKKPSGLIRYKALTDQKIRWFRPRVLFYGGLLGGTLMALIFAVIVHSNLRIEILRGKDTPYVSVERDGESTLQNHFLLRLANTGTETIHVSMKLDEPVHAILPENPIQILPGAKKDMPFILEIPAAKMDPSGKMELKIQMTQKTETKLKQTHKKVPFLGPFRGQK